MVSRTPANASAELLARYRFDERRFAAFADAVAAGTLFPGSTVYRGALEPPRNGDLLELPPPRTPARDELDIEGRAILARGDVAVVILAGGMATRFSQPGESVVKGTVEVADGYSFLALKLTQLRALGRDVGRPVPVALMTSFATEDGVIRHLEEQALSGPDVTVFSQSVTLRLTPGGQVFHADRDAPLPSSSYTTPGHGDTFDALRDSGVLGRLRASGVRTIWLCNVDNLGATLDPALVALFERTRATHGTSFMAEVVERRPEDGAKVGVVVRAATDDGERLRILEGFRVPEGLDQSRLTDVSINSFFFDAAALEADVALDVHAVKKEVDGEAVIQGETILCEATGSTTAGGAPRFRFAAVRVPRDGAGGRFFEGRFAPVKTPRDLEALRGPVSASLPALLPGRSRRRQRAVDAAVRGFAPGGAGETHTFWSPGRINLIGEHTDYSDGFCLPAAVDHGVWAAVRARTDHKLLVRSNLFPDVVEVDLGALDAPPAATWGRSLPALVRLLRERGVAVGGAQVALESDLPTGAGMSSSASFHLAVAASLVRVAGARVSPLDLARVAQATENAMGLRVGILDPYAIAHARRGHALWLDCRSMTHREIRLDLGAHTLVVGDTRKPRGLAESAYNERRAQCEEAARLLAGLTGRPIRALRDVTAEDLATHGVRLPPLLKARATHVVEENARVALAVNALEQGDTSRFGELLNQSHVSLRDLFEVSCLELDALVDAALSLGRDAVPGARMMGGGFGGCTLSLVKRSELERFVAEVAPRYRQETGLEPAFYVVSAEDGLGELPA